jgi:energy-coupling factor transport system substrate-specific component
MQQTRKALLGSLLTAVAVALGIALSAVPNVELMTLIVFVSGFLIGAAYGMVVGAAAIALHSLFNPLGAALPPLFVAQIVGFAAVGACGGLLGVRVMRIEQRWISLAACGALGFVLTIVYDVLTNVGAFFTITGEHAPESLVKFIVAGLVFTIMHVVWNTGLFLMTLRPILIVLDRYRDELAEGR